MRLDCVRGEIARLKPAWVVYDIDTGLIWGFTYADSSELAWSHAADRLGNCVAESGFDFAKYAIPREHVQ